MSTDEIFMREALRQAKKAYGKMETPIGCVIVWEGKIIARGPGKSIVHRDFQHGLIRADQFFHRILQTDILKQFQKTH